ncbi:MAG: hypothetical protein AAB539_01965 [Patescibacteria group bacterium]
MGTMRIDLDELMSARIMGLAKVLGTTSTLLVHDLLQSALRGHNQTEEEWLEGIDDKTLGTGFFITPDVTQSEIGAVKKVAVPDLTYFDCVRRGQNVTAYQWVPHSVRSYEDLMKST